MVKPKFYVFIKSIFSYFKNILDSFDVNKK